MADTIYLKVKNWERFQQYKDGRPLRWIKLYVKLLGDWEFEQLPELTQLRLMKLWLVAAERDNKIPCDPAWIERRIGARSPVDVLTMVEDGWLDVHDPHDVENVRKVLSERDVQSRTKGGTGDVRFTRSREERRGEESRGTEGSSLRSSPSGASPAVENSPEDDGETWNDRLAPVVREVAYLGTGPPEGWKISRCMSRLKQLKDQGYSTGELEDGLRGLRWMVEREHEAICDKEGTPFIRRGSKFRCVVFNRAEERGMPLLRTAAHQWRKHGEPSENGRTGDLERVTA